MRKDEKNIPSEPHEASSSRQMLLPPARKEHKSHQSTLAYGQEQVLEVEYRPSFAVKIENPNDLLSQNGQLQGRHLRRIEDDGDDEHSRNKILAIIDQLKTASKRKTVELIMSMPQVDCPLAEALIEQETDGFTQEKKEFIEVLFNQAGLRREKHREERSKQRKVLTERESFFNRRFLVFLTMSAVSEAAVLAFIHPKASSSSSSPSLNFNNSTLNSMTLPIAQSVAPSTFTIIKASAVAILFFVVALLYLYKKLTIGSKITDLYNEDSEDYQHNFRRPSPK